MLLIWIIHSGMKFVFTTRIANYTSNGIPKASTTFHRIVYCRLSILYISLNCHIYLATLPFLHLLFSASLSLYIFFPGSNEKVKHHEDTLMMLSEINIS